MSPYSKALAGLLLVSAVLRFVLADSGGQLFWPDESRFTESQTAANRIEEGHFAAANAALFTHSEHVLFKVIGVIPSLARDYGAPSWFPAFFFGIFSVGSIYLVWRISLKAGGDPQEALLAASFAACSASLLYFSRHLFPYDIALCLALLGLDLALGARRSFLVGVCCSLAFLTYNGYWMLCAVVMVVGAVSRAQGVGGVAKRGAFEFLGASCPVLLVAAFERAAGTNYFKDVLQFSGTITMGDFREGWTFIAKYLWQCDKAIFVLGAILVAVATGSALKGNRRHLLGWVACLAGLYLGLSFLCAGLHKFVLYGRVARSVVPFLALGAGGGLACLGEWGRRGRLLQAALVAAILVQAGFNFDPVLTQRYPDQFRAAAQRRGESVPLMDRPGLRILNAYPFPWSEAFHYQAILTPVPDRYRTVLSSRHPLQYQPFQFEGYSPDQRDLFNANDITMRLVLLEGEGAKLAAPPDPSLGGYLGALRIDATLPQLEFVLGEPLVTTGVTAHGDFFYIVCKPRNGTIRIGMDHWGYGGAVTEPIAVDFSKPHRFEVTMGSLLPPPDSPFYRKNPQLAAYTRRALVALDGRVVYDQQAECNPSQSGDVSVGTNLIWGSTCRPNYTGTILRVEPIDPRSIGTARPQGGANRP